MQLSGEARHRGTDHVHPEPVTCVMYGKAAGEAVGTVQEQIRRIIGRQQAGQLRVGKVTRLCGEVQFRVLRVQHLRHHLRLGPPHIFPREKRLPVQIVVGHFISIKQREPPHPGPGQVGHHRCAQRTQPHHRHVGGRQARLPTVTDRRELHLPLEIGAVHVTRDCPGPIHRYHLRTTRASRSALSV